MLGYLNRQRKIAAEYIGRPLRSDEQVHHVNGDRRDNRHENLMVLPTREHQRLHKLGKRMPLSVRRKISAALTGMPKSPEHIRHAAEGQRGKIIPPEVRMKLSIAMRGKECSLVARRKLSIAARRQWDDPQKRNGIMLAQYIGMAKRREREYAPWL